MSYSKILVRFNEEDVPLPFSVNPSPVSSPGQMDFIPECVGQIYKNGFGGAADDDPLEGEIARRIDLLVGKPCRNIEEIACVYGAIELSSLAPANKRRAAKHVGDRVLLAVMVYCSAGGRFNTKDAPQMGEGGERLPNRTDRSGLHKLIDVA